MMLYRLFGVRGRLLYIGVSKNYLLRLKGHAVDSWWFSDVRVITLEKCSTKKMAHTKELAAIGKERPAYNIRGAQKPELKWSDFVYWGRVGGKAAAAKMTAKQRSERARKAGRAKGKGKK